LSDPYKLLAEKLDALPNGFPPTSDGAELRLLAYLFNAEEAALAAQLTSESLSAVEIAALPGIQADENSVGQMLKGMARKGLIEARRSAGGLGFKLMPFVVGIYEAQIGRIDAELARLFENYYLQSFGEALRLQPAFHRVIPIEESVQVDLSVHPYESAAGIVDSNQAWGVLDCICRTQKALIGQACQHPIDVCMAFGPQPGIFDHHPVIRPLTREQAHATLKRAANAGLVHSVSNSQEGISYVCNCCTCSCGILRGMAEMGIANVVASSPFVNQLDSERCIVCEACLPYCYFGALELDNGYTQVNPQRCVGCGLCIPACPENALSLARRPSTQAAYIPRDFSEWAALRTSFRNS
jgi:ferredoxin